MQRSDLGKKITWCINNLDEITNSLNESLVTLSEIASDENISINDRNKALLGIKVLNGYDFGEFSTIISIIASLDKVKNLKRARQLSSDEMDEAIEWAIKIDSSKCSGHYIKDSEEYYSINDAPQALQPIIRNILIKTN